MNRDWLNEVLIPCKPVSTHRNLLTALAACCSQVVTNLLNEKTEDINLMSQGSSFCCEQVVEVNGLKVKVIIKSVE